MEKGITGKDNASNGYFPRDPLFPVGALSLARYSVERTNPPSTCNETPVT